ncbi:hypothetical protein LXL04_006771 [Taraxacum kok-saghyz]
MAVIYTFSCFGCLKSINLQDVTYFVFTGDLRRHRPPWPRWQRMAKSIICSLDVVAVMFSGQCSRPILELLGSELDLACLTVRAIELKPIANLRYISVVFRDVIIGRILILLSIRVEAEFAEERTEDHGTTSSQPRRSDRGGFPYNISCCTLCGLHVYVLSVRVTSHYFASVALSVRGCWTVRVYVTLAEGTRPGESRRCGSYDLSGRDSGCVDYEVALELLLPFDHLLRVEVTTPLAPKNPNLVLKMDPRTLLLVARG